MKKSWIPQIMYLQKLWPACFVVFCRVNRVFRMYPNIIDDLSIPAAVLSNPVTGLAFYEGEDVVESCVIDLRGPLGETRYVEVHLGWFSMLFK